MSLCSDRFRLQSFVDGQLSEAEAAALAAHLRVCTPCARLAAGLRRVSAPLEAPAAPVPEGLQARLLGAVAGVTALPPLDCATAWEYACLRVDGRLSHELCQRLQAHLDACAPCAAAAGQLELTSTMLRAVGAEAAPAGLLERIGEATAFLRQEAPRRAPLLRRWAPSIGAVAAAAALVCALLTRAPLPLTTAPQVAVRSAPPAIETVAPRNTPLSGPAVRPPTPVAPRLAAVGPVAPHPLRTATTPAALPAPAPVRPVVPAATTVATPPAAPPAPPVVPLPSSAPVAVAVAPAPVEGHGGATLTMAPRLYSPAAEAPSGHVPDVTAGARIAAADTGKSTPAVEVAAPAVERPRPSRVSRAVTEDREVYTSGDSDTRLAEARNLLRDHAETMRDNEVRGFVIH